MKSLLDKYIEEETNLSKSILPADIYFSKEILRASSDSKGRVAKEEKAIRFPVKPVRMSKYNYEGNELRVPVKSISKILNPEKIL